MCSNSRNIFQGARFHHDVDQAALLHGLLHLLYVPREARAAAAARTRLVDALAATVPPYHGRTLACLLEKIVFKSD